MKTFNEIRSDMKALKAYRYQLQANGVIVPFDGGALSATEVKNYIKAVDDQDDKLRVLELQDSYFYANDGAYNDVTNQFL